MILGLLIANDVQLVFYSWRNNTIYAEGEEDYIQQSAEVEETNTMHLSSGIGIEKCTSTAGVLSSDAILLIVSR